MLTYADACSAEALKARGASDAVFGARLNHAAAAAWPRDRDAAADRCPRAPLERPAGLVERRLSLGHAERRFS